MKKFILLSASLFYSIFILVGFSSKRKTIPGKIISANDIIACSPNLITAETFKARYEPGGLKVRKNIDSFTLAEINAYKVGIIKMRALPYTNPTSWLYQAAIHGTTMTDNLPSWNACHRVGEEYFFLAWHRMYVYFFERIIRAKCGRANFAIPYWNYQLDPTLHPAFRENIPGNPLYTLRNSSINAGGALPSSIMTTIVNGLALVPYTNFQSSMIGPHGAVHTAVSGDMASILTAAKDPVFWLHHSNIDRLWEEWLNKCNGRANPVDTVWQNKSFTFFDENGTAVSMLGSQVVKAAMQLNYRYDCFSGNQSCPAARGLIETRQPILTKSAAVDISSRIQKTDFSHESPDRLESFIRANHRTSFRFNNSSAQERLILTFEDIRIQQMPQGVVEVYMNIPAGVTPVSTSRYFIGLLDLFSAQHHLDHNTPGAPAHVEVELDATKAAQALRLTPAALQNATISFYIRGNTLNGREETVEANITVPRMQFSVVESRNQ